MSVRDNYYKFQVTILPYGSIRRKTVTFVYRTAKNAFSPAKYKMVYKSMKNIGIKETIKKVNRKMTSPKIEYALDYKEEIKKEYQEWIKCNEPNAEQLEMQRKHKFTYEPKISLLVPMYNTKVSFFRELVDSVINQTYANVELCLVDGSPEKNEEIEKIAKEDKRIKYNYTGINGGISENTNEAAKLATGDYYGLLDHDDILPIFSLYEVVKAINENNRPDFIYTDEDKFEKIDGLRYDPFFKPDFSIDLLRSHNYICHFSLFKKELFNKVGGFRKPFDGSQDYDIILRLTEISKNIVHIPKILYNWRVHEGSVAFDPNVKLYAFEAGKRAIEEHLKRCKIDAEVIMNKQYLGHYDVVYKVKGEPLVSIIIPNKDNVKTLKECLKSIREKTTYTNYEIIIAENNSNENTFKYYQKIMAKDKKIKVEKIKIKDFNYAKINNEAVKKSKGEYILFLNNDTKIITPNYIERMLGNAQRKEVGAVGVKLVYPDNTIQHVGVRVTDNLFAAHANIGQWINEPGYFSWNLVTKNVTAVTAACMMISRKKFDMVKGFDETLKVAYNDVDLCLKLRQKNLLNVMTPLVEVYHFESKTRGIDVHDEKKKARLMKEQNILKEKWKHFMKIQDPFYNPNLTTNTMEIRIKKEKVNLD